jgi:hypothetical protein
MTVHSSVLRALSWGLLAGFTLSPALAVDFVVPAGGTDTDGVQLTAGDSLTNGGAISFAGSHVVTGTGSPIAFILNTVDGTITSTTFSDDAINSSGDVTLISNAGLISSTGFSSWAIDIAGSVATFENSGTIFGVSSGVRIDSSTGTFTNSGTISSGSSTALRLNGSVASFSNLATGVIETTNESAMIAYNVETFNNAGRIWGETDAVALYGNVGTYTNSGTLFGDGGAGVFSAGTVESFVNLEGGSISGYRQGALFSDKVEQFSNAGTIVATGANKAAVEFREGFDTFINAGVLIGDYAILSDGDFDETYKLLTGSEIRGTADFGGGTDVLDLSDYCGTAVLRIENLEVLESGDRPVALAGTLTDGDIVIFDPTGSSGAGGATHDMLGAIRDAIAAQFGRGGGGLQAPATISAFLADPAQSEASAVLTALDTGSTNTGVKVWGAAFGGMGTDDEPVAVFNAYGGVVGGAQVEAGNHAVGLVGAYSHGVYEVGEQHTVLSYTGVGGIYGRYDFSGIALDYSLLGGGGAHDSSREIVAVDATETMTGDFTSWFVAPGAAVSIPVLADDGGQVNLAVAATYLHGATSAYTESSPSLSVAVGEQSFGIFEGRLEVNGYSSVGDLLVRGKAGLFAQSNVGVSSVPVTFDGAGLVETTSYSEPGTTSYGGYFGTGFSVPIGPTALINFDISGSLVEDSASGAASAGVAGTF